MEKDKIELKTIMETAEVADYLTALAKGFRAGRIVVEKDGEHLVLSPAAMSRAEVEIEARIKKDKAKFSLELSWNLAPAVEEGAEFKISTELPKPVVGYEEKCGDKKPEAKKSEDKKPTPQGAMPADKPAAVQAKSDVKPAAPALHEPGGKAVVAAVAQAKPKP
ncbi:MAG: amphi-Trp domain-containing protein [Humidesulfovibrio sp.]|nr:amphi-Trp domain-containing protein [Humidesulfovibrio sp.]